MYHFSLSLSLSFSVSLSLFASSQKDFRFFVFFFFSSESWNSFSFIIKNRSKLRASCTWHAMLFVLVFSFSFCFRCLFLFLLHFLWFVGVCLLSATSRFGLNVYFHISWEQFRNWIVQPELTVKTRDFLPSSPESAIFWPWCFVIPLHTNFFQLKTQVNNNSLDVVLLENFSVKWTMICLISVVMKSLNDSPTVPSILSWLLRYLCHFFSWYLLWPNNLVYFKRFCR